MKPLLPRMIRRSLSGNSRIVGPQMASGLVSMSIHPKLLSSIAALTNAQICAAAKAKKAIVNWLKDQSARGPLSSGVTRRPTMLKASTPTSAAESFQSQAGTAFQNSVGSALLGRSYSSISRSASMSMYEPKRG